MRRDHRELAGGQLELRERELLGSSPPPRGCRGRRVGAAPDGVSRVATAGTCQIRPASQDLAPVPPAVAGLLCNDFELPADLPPQDQVLARAPRLLRRARAERDGRRGVHAEPRLRARAPAPAEGAVYVILSSGR